MNSLSRNLQRVADEWESKNRREKGLMSRRIDELEEEKENLEETLETLRGELAAAKGSTLSAQLEAKRFSDLVDETKQELRTERCRVLGALFLVADLTRGGAAAAKKKKTRRGGRKKKKLHTSSPPPLPSPPPPAFVEDDDLVLVPPAAAVEDNEQEEEEEEETSAAASAAVAEYDEASYLMAKKVAESIDYRTTALELVEASSAGKLGLVERFVRRKKCDDDDALCDVARAVLSVALDRSARSGHSRVCSLLIEAGARAEHACSDVCDLEQPIRCFRMEEHKQLEERSVEGDEEEKVFEGPALHAAIAGGYDDVAKLLIAGGANVNAISSKMRGATPLHVAAAHNRPTLAHFLVSKCNARFEVVDDLGRTPEDVAVSLRWHAVAKVLKDPSVLFWARANRANRLCREGEHELALESFELALRELGRCPKARMPSTPNVMALHNNHARSLMTLGRHIAARDSLTKALGTVDDLLAYHAPCDKLCECDAKLFEHEKAAVGWEKLVERHEHGGDVDDSKVNEWRAKAKNERAKVALKNHEVLGISARASLADTKKAYRAQSIKWHPDRYASKTPEDKHRAHLQFQRVSSAYEALVKQKNPHESEEEESSDDDDDEDDATPDWSRSRFRR